MFAPPRNPPYFYVAIPSSVVSEAPDLREKTRKVGYIARALSIYRVEGVYVYNDSGAEDLRFVESVLRYSEVPPYLKRHLVKLSPYLKYAALVPPLKIPPHLRLSETGIKIKDGVVVNVANSSAEVFIGESKNALVRGVKLQLGSRVTVRILRETDEFFEAEIVDRRKLDIYWGFDVYTADSMLEVLNRARKQRFYIIGATKEGRLITEVFEDVVNAVKTHSRILVVFGGPKSDIFDIAAREGFKIDDYCDIILNFVPHQGTISIRTEEALHAVLSILNLLKELKSGKANYSG